MQTALKAYFVLAFLGVLALTQSRVNKCCPLHERFKYHEGEFVCVADEDAGDVAIADWWTRTEGDLLLDNATSDNSWLVDVLVVEGRRPRCAPGSSDVLLLSETETDFNLLLGEDNEVSLQVLKDAAHHDPVTVNKTTYPHDDYCIDTNTAMFVVLLCPCRAVPCVRKCCWDSEAYNQTTRECQHVDDFPYQVYDWVPGIYNDTKERIRYYRLTQTAPDCLQKAVHVIPHRLDEEAKLILLADGSIQATDTGHIYTTDRYCGDFTVDNDEMIHYCLDYDDASASDTLLHIYGAIFLLSSAALFLTVVLTLLVEHMRSNLFLVMALMHNMMLLIGFTATGVAQLSGHYMAQTACSFISLTIQFSILASVFWLNAMCFDISWLCSGLEQMRGGHRQSSRHRYIAYSLYAWGSTSLISLATVIAEYSPGLDAWSPEFGQGTCFFNNRRATWLLFYGPMGVLVVANVAMLGVTTWRMMTSQRHHTMLDVQEDARLKHRHKLLLFMKLFLLLGTCWIFEVLSWAVDSRSAFWVFTDVINLLRGVFIFIIFCCNQPVYRSVRERARQIRGCCGGSETGRHSKNVGNRLELDELVNEE